MAKKGKYIYDWPRPMVSVDAIVFTPIKSKWHILLIKRGRYPFEGRWAIPGGFLEIDEELETAAARELQEETGLSGIPLKQMQTFGKCGRDPRGRMITVTFMGITPKDNNKIKAGDDAASAKWFDIDHLPSDMAFDHNEVAVIAIKRLRRKVNNR